MNKRKFILGILSIILLLTLSTLIFGINEYEEKFLGVWENEEDPDLMVFEEDNIFYMIDEDEIRVSENGRWSATATKVSIELKYNGKKYRMISEYEFIDDDTVKIKIIKNFIDGKEEELENTEYIAIRWEG